MIQTATGSINLCFYDIDDPAMVQALADAAGRGVRVRIVTETDNLLDKQDRKSPRQAITALSAAGIAIRDDARPGLMHHKFMVVDGKTAWFGSVNLTTTSLYQHNNNGLEVHSAKLAALFDVEFERLMTEGLFGPGEHVVADPFVRVGNVAFQVYFSPRSGARVALLDAVKRARASIRILAFALTDEELGEVLAAKHRHGLLVEAILDDCMISQHSLYWDLRKKGMDIERDGNQALMHHKVIIIDDQVVICGSYNYSMSAENGNNENMVIIRSVGVAAQFRDEYERLRKAAKDHKDIPPYDHPACRDRREVE